MAIGRVQLERGGNQERAGRIQEPAPPQHRQRGLWNFLTWSFFLSQILAAESFMGAAARTQEDGGNTHGAADGSSAAAAGGATYPSAAHIGRVDDVATTGHELSGAEHAPPLQPLEGSATAMKDLPGVHASGGGNVAAMGSAGEGANGSPTAVDEPGILPTIGSIGDAVDHAISPVLGTVDSLVGSLDPILDHALAPVLSVADHMPQPVDAMVGEAVATVISSVEPILAPTHATADTVLQPVASFVDQDIAPLSDVLGHRGVVASPGSIMVSEPPHISTHPLDDLFAKGTYTPYHLSLNAELAPTSASLLNGGSVASMIDNIIGDQHGANATHDGQDGPMAAHSLQTSVVDDLHFRGLAEGHGLL
jgi:hypothetical protein